MATPLMIYNLFPLLAGELPRWPAVARRARQLGFDWIYLNPVHYPGFSGSLYAVKDYHRLNPLLVPGGEAAPLRLLGRTLDALHAEGLKVMLDLVVNHTSKDSLLAQEHPEWFRRDPAGDLVSPSAIDPADARKVTVWGDLAELDHAGSADAVGLRRFFCALTGSLLELGFDGFRCDAAYKVPAETWAELIGAARRRRPGALFAAETLGCRLAEVRALSAAGFDYLFNSAKYWNFDQPWALQQHAEFGAIAPSVAFPESHDTPRLMAETGGLLQVQRQRYAFCACFSAGILMPMGYERCARRALDVVHTRPEHAEEAGPDLGPFVARLNALKRELPVLGVEGHWEVVTTLDAPTTVLRKRGEAGARPVLVLVNKDWHAPQAVQVPRAELPPAASLLRPCLEPEPPPAAVSLDAALTLAPAEVALIS